MAVVCILGSQLSMFGITRYVKTSASGTGDGSSWANAGTLTQQLLSANSGDQLWVQAGVYTPQANWSGNYTPTDSRTKTFFIKEGITLYGGFSGTETAVNQRTLWASPSILDGNIGDLQDSLDNAYHVLVSVITGTGNVLVDGFTIKRGVANINSNSELINGASIPMGFGAGLFSSGGSVQLNNCIISNNHTTGQGGAIQSLDVNLVISNSFIIDNSSSAGGAITCGNKSFTSYSSVYAYNRANNGSGGALAITMLVGSITNCTFYKNQCSTFGGAIYVNSNQAINIDNNIFNSNTKVVSAVVSVSEIYDFTGISVCRYNCLELPASTYPTYAASNLFATVPFFVNESDWDGTDNQPGTLDDGLSVYTCSPTHEAGSSFLVHFLNATDIRGDMRVAANHVDIGAYEFTSPANLLTSIQTAPSSVLVCPGIDTMFRAIAQGEMISFQWYKDDVLIPGETNDTIRFTSLSSAHLGQYKIKVSGKCGSVFSTNVSLSFHQEPLIIIPPSASNVCEGSPLVLGAYVDGTQLQFSWEKDNAVIAGATDDTLKFASLVNTDRGVYKIKVKDICNRTLESDPVTIKANPNLRRYVKQSATGNNNGLSWTNAYPNLQDAINNSCIGSSVWIAAGTYYPDRDQTGNVLPSDNRTKTFLLTDGIKLIGGFAGTETSIAQRVMEANPTILSGDLGILGSDADNAYHVAISFFADSAVELDGIIIQQGNANIGDSRSINGANIFDSSGGGLYAFRSSITMRRCKIKNNNSDYGSGCLFSSCTVNSFKNEFISNTGVEAYGGGMSVENSFMISESDYFYGNTSLGGAAIYTYESRLISYNALIAFNAGLEEAAVYHEPGSAKVTFVNSTFLSNSNATTGKSAAFYTDVVDTIANSIFWDNEVDGDPQATMADLEGPASIVLRNCLLQGPSSTYGFTDASGMLYQTDPLLVNSSNLAGPDGYWGTSDDGSKISAVSPAVNAGSMTAFQPWMLQDAFGMPRLNGPFVDLGAHEYQDPASTHRANVSGIHFSVYPNPASEFLHVRVEQPIQGEISVYTYQGTQLSTQPWTGTEGRYSINQLPGGMYVIQIRNSQGTIQLPFVKQ